MSEDDEINAMGKIAAALGPLDEPTRARVLQWASSRFRSASGPAPVNHANDSPTTPGDTQRFETFAELFEVARPTTEREKALIAAYWEQVGQGEASFGSQTLNDALKHLGHGVGNITDALSALKDERPALVLQLKKSGSSKQARKTYKLTQEGVRRVQAMLQRDASDAT